jgi:hypothetical protein
MPRTPGTQPTPRSPQPVGQTLVAAGISYPGLAKRSTRRAPVQKKAWQREQWDFFEEVGEYAFAQTWQSNVCSRARFEVKKRESDGTLTKLPPTHKGVVALNELTNGPQGQGEFIRMATLHLGAAAECYLVNRRMQSDDAPLREVGADEHVWEVVGTEEINDNGGTWTITYDGGRTIPLEEDDVVIRVWLPHPRNRFNAFSLSKSALPILREIRGYDLHIQAQQDSRLTGNGMLLFPAEMTLKPPQTWDLPLDATVADIVTATFLDAAMMSKEIRGDASSQVPVMFTPPGEFIDKIKHVKFWTDFDDKVVSGREKSLVRLATTLDLPKEVVTGTGDMNRWGAWQVEESSIKVHIEPRLDMLADVITREYLVPATNDPSLVITVDTAILRLRPNRSKEAIELYDRGVLNEVALMRETGFDPDADGMDEEQFKRWALITMMKASYTPRQAQAAGLALGIDLGIPLEEDNAPREARPTPSLEDHPTRDVPDESIADGTKDRQSDLDLTASAATSTCAAMLSYRAIERAGNRLRSLSKVKPDSTIAPHAVHTVVKVFPDKVDELVDHAWSTAETFGISQTDLDRARNYSRFLLTEGIPFNLDEAVSYIRSGRLV